MVHFSPIIIEILIASVNVCVLSCLDVGVGCEAIFLPTCGDSHVELPEPFLAQSGFQNRGNPSDCPVILIYIKCIEQLIFAFCLMRTKIMLGRSSGGTMTQHTLGTVASPTEQNKSQAKEPLTE